MLTGPGGELAGVGGVGPDLGDLGLHDAQTPKEFAGGVPVDLMTRLFAETSGCPRVYGIGSNLDSARYRLVLGRLPDVPADAARGHVIGEHGDHAVVWRS